MLSVACDQIVTCRCTTTMVQYRQIKFLKFSPLVKNEGFFLKFLKFSQKIVKSEDFSHRWLLRLWWGSHSLLVVAHRTRPQYENWKQLYSGKFRWFFGLGAVIVLIWFDIVNLYKVWGKKKLSIANTCRREVWLGLPCCPELLANSWVEPQQLKLTKRNWFLK